MSVVLKLSPGFGDSVPPQAEVDLAAGEQETGASIGSLLARAGISPEVFGEAVNSELSVIVMVNNRILRPPECFDMTVTEGDVVWFLLPLSGG